MMRGTENRYQPASRKLAAVGAALTFALILGVSDYAGAAWDGKQSITLGDSVSAELTGDAMEQAHQYEFFAPKNTMLNAAGKVAAGLTLDIKVYDRMGVEVPLGAALVGTKIKKFVFAEGGWYTLRVGATGATAGRYTFKTKGKYPKKYTFTGDTGGELGFEAVQGSLLTASAKKAKGSGAVPVFDELEGPFGMVGLGTEGPKLKKIMLPFGGHYSLNWRNDGTAGDAVNAKLIVKAPKSKVAWTFGTAEDTDGIVAAQRNDWLGSGHADATAEAFVHWDEDGSISTSCAACHSTYGYQDYLGADGTPNLMTQNSEMLFPNATDSTAALGSTVHCDACHDPLATALDEVVLPSGAHLTGLGPEARCMTCHQGRESNLSLQFHIDSKAPADDDTQAGLSFQNIHYFAAGATLYGGLGQGAAQYEGKFYNGLSTHVDDYNTCIECHDPHTLEVRFDECAACHPGTTDGATARDTIRMARSVRDYDGDGDVTEGIYGELDTMAATLFTAMRDYARTVAMSPIGYNSDAYPYFFVDDNDNGTIDEGESTRYASWTVRLLKAAYNYQYFLKDPGAFAHNRKYMIECLYDSIENLDAHASVTVAALPNMWRSDSGHFDAGGEAYRHWDFAADEIQPGSIVLGEVSSSCARCHSAEGFDFWAEYGIDIPKSTSVADGLSCETCHEDYESDPTDPPRKFIAEVEFPGGVVIENDDAAPDDSFICMSCHKGRQSMADVDARIASGSLSFRNVHYFPAGATIYGGDANVAYEYAGKSYMGKWDHNGGGNGAKCAYCHLEDHSFEPQWNQNACGGCHGEASSLDTIRKDRDVDYNGVNGTNDSLHDEVATFGNAVYTEMKARAIAQGLDHILYDSHSYPYWFVDNDDDGVADDADMDGEADRYGDWDVPLFKASFNYQYWQKEPGAWAHNTIFIIQILYDTVEDLGGDVSNFTRP